MPVEIESQNNLTDQKAHEIQEIRIEFNRRRPIPPYLKNENINKWQ